MHPEVLNAAFSSDSDSDSNSDSDYDSEPRSPAHKRQRRNCRAPPLPSPVDYDDAYFQSYSHMGVHNEIFKDYVLINTYKKAIMHHRANIEGKVVLDVGCGTGLLSMFCAQAGARKVYAVEASDIAEKVKHINSHTITIPELASITLDFETKTLKRGMVTGFAFWFDADFSGLPNSDINPQKAPLLLTGPDNHQKTHWEQTLIYFSDPIEVQQCQTIKGSVKLSQCQRNNRFIDVRLELSANDISLTKQCTVG
ncbi:hypothetical protein PIB30_082125 [Stylosanthes scabra]|uniref:Protein arginine N-methyltransferase domain-containing protein n=1 Tax=Stylosanthes scabra TaxID=79078 RepID=A0ABU6QRI3_9FABA|nr:hypothetical protein [Stylosanthes scabra]